MKQTFRVFIRVFRNTYRGDREQEIARDNKRERKGKQLNINIAYMHLLYLKVYWEGMCVCMFWYSTSQLAF